MQEVTSFSAGNYKSFLESTRVEVAPLTILFGYNSAGKSALMRLPALLADSILGPNSSPLNLRSEAIRGASFRDLVCNIGTTPTLRFLIEWKGAPFSSVGFELRELPDRRRHIVERLNLTEADGSQVELFWDAESLSDEYIVRVQGEEMPSKVRLTFDGLLPSVEGSETAFGETFSWLALSLEPQLRHFARQVTWLKALREVPQRWEVFRGAPYKMKPTGEGASQILASDYFAGGEVLARVSSWYERATGHSLSITRGGYGNEELFSILLTAKGAQGQTPIADTGEGMAQVFPVVTYLAAMAANKAPGMLIAEHPELHLHPAAHGELAGLFCEAATSGAAKSIVETHSENFLLGVQLAIARGTISPDRVRLYWVRRSGAEAVAERIDLDSLGKPKADAWPPGMFSENVVQARELALVRRDKRSGKNEDHA